MNDEEEPTLKLRCRVNGRARANEVPLRLTLADYVRDVLGLTGTHVGCEQGMCGACTVRVDGDIVRSCLMLAVQAEGCDIETVEGATASGRIADLQDSFHRHAALQCGFCTPGMLAAADDALCRSPCLSREEARQALTGHYCRCTGYQTIVDAIMDTARKRSGCRAD